MTAGWAERQQATMAWYRGLLDDPAAAAAELIAEYRPLAPLLGGLRGAVLDVGGGPGMPRHHLGPEARYLCVDPDAGWDDPRWSALAPWIPSFARPAERVRAEGEQLPFDDASFDAALALWSLNHVRDPERVIGQVARVLRPGGRLVITVEDIGPRWLDLLDPATPDGRRVRYELARTKLSCWVRGRPWPVGPDHLPLSEAGLRAWLGPSFVVRRRRWLGEDHGLLLVAERRP